MVHGRKRLKQYKINDIFYSIQGEGARVGTPSIFIRFSHCNLACSFCDTEFESGRMLTIDDVGKWVEDIKSPCNSIVITGGEPTLQLDEDFIHYFKELGYFISVETNGLLPVPSEIDWITVSPKTAEHTLKQKFANELKYVRNYGQGIPNPKIESHLKFISPQFSGNHLSNETLGWCIRLVKDNPEWRLLPQLHKIWEVE